MPGMAEQKDPQVELSDFLSWAVVKTSRERGIRLNELITTNDDFRRLAQRKGFLEGSAWQDLPARTVDDQN